MDKTKIARITIYLSVSLAAIVCSKVLQHILSLKSISDIYGLEQISKLIPCYAVCIIIPFLLAAMYEIVLKEYKKTRLFYLSIFAVVLIYFVSQAHLLISGGKDFGIFRIIAYFCGGFTDMIIYDRIEIFVIKKM